MLVESTGAGGAPYDWTVAVGASVNYTLTRLWRPLRT